MNYDHYLLLFQNAADKLNKKVLQKKQLEVATVIVLDSVCLKIYKTAWSSDVNDALNATSRIFFSIWINDTTIAEQKMMYNIHALKLRHLKGYGIASRDFADAFRKQFKPFQKQWENVSTQFGPLTLMEGWQILDDNNLEKQVTQLANNFLQIDHLIDDTLQLFIKK